MKGYLLLFLSTTLLLFALPKGGLTHGVNQMEQGQVVKKSCAKKAYKRPCARKCLKHQTHSEQREAGTVVNDCSQPFYAILGPPQTSSLFAGDDSYKTPLSAPRRHLAPDLANEPDPPRFS